MVLFIIVIANKMTIIFFLGNKNHIVLFLYIVVIVCANLTSNSVILKKIADSISANRRLQRLQNILMLTSISILFSIIQVLMSIRLSIYRAKNVRLDL